MILLVTGGAGFIGSNFIRHALGHTTDSIINLDLFTYASSAKTLSEFSNHPRYTFVKGDICDQKLVYELTQKVDAIVNFAAESHVDRSIEDPFQFMRTNIIGTTVLLESARLHGNKRFHQISTDEVFGSLTSEGVFSEDSPYLPRSPYAASKAGADHIARAYYHTHNLPVTISHCSNNYGPYQHPEKFIANSITNILEGKKITVYGDGSNVRDWINVTDHISGIRLVLDKGVIGRTYAFGGNTEIKNIKVAKLITEVMEVGESMIEFVEDRKGHDYRYAIDTSKAEKELDWKSTKTFEKGLEETIQWYKEHVSWWKPLKHPNE